MNSELTNQSDSAIRYQTSMPKQSHTLIMIGNPTNSSNAFDAKSIRNAFVTKVYSIVGCQLLFTLAILALVMFNEPVKAHLRYFYTVYSLVGLIGFIFVYFALVCVDSMRREVPTNYIMLALLTCFLTLTVAAMSAHYESISVLCAVGTTAIATLLIVFMAACCPYDLTGCGCALYVLALAHMLISTVIIITLSSLGYASVGSLIVAGLGAFLFSLYLLYDLQLIMGGRKHELSPEEYVLAAILVYVDIILIFQYILILFGNSN